MARDNEDYLDQLLNSVQEQETPNKNSTGQMDELLSFMGHMEDGDGDMDFAEEKSFSQRARKKERKREDRGKRAADQFLNEFEKELQEADMDRLISDYELAMEEENAEEKDQDLPMEDFFQGLDKVMDSLPKSESREESKVAENKSAYNPDDSIKDSDTTESSENSDQDLLNLLSGLTNEEASEEVIAEVETNAPVETEESSDEASDTDSSEEEGLSPEEIAKVLAGDMSALESGDEEKATEAPVPGSDDDILSVLEGLGDEGSDFADIKNLLDADANNEPLSPDGEDTSEGADLSVEGQSSTEDILAGLEGLGFDVDPSDAEELSGIKEKGDKSSKVKTKKEDGDSEDKPKKPGFLKKLALLFFGPEEEENEGKEQEANTGNSENLEGISDENLDILRALEGGDQKAADPLQGLDEAAIKKLEKEQKKAEKKARAEEKKAAKKAAAEAKKAEKAAKKAAKPKKEKKPKVKDNTPPLPKLPVFLIFVMCASIFAIVVFAGKGVNYNNSLKSAKDLYSQGRYYEAYEKVHNVEFKEKDVDFSNRLFILAGMDELLSGYDTLKSSGREELALDSLIRVVGHYDANIEKAGALGISSEITELEGRAEDILKTEYKTSYDDALSIYSIRNRVNYSLELMKILKKVGLK